MMRTARWSVIVILAVAAAACGGGGDDRAPVRAAADAAEPARAAPDIGGDDPGALPFGDGEVGGPNDRSGVQAPSSPATSRADAPADEPAVGNPSTRAEAAAPEGPPRPAKPGTYAMDTDGWSRIGDGPQRPLPKSTTLRVDAAEGDRQRVVRDIRDADGTGAVTEQLLQYGADGVRLAGFKIRTTLGGVARTYTFAPSPAPIVLTGDPKPGDRTAFQMTGDGVTISSTVTVRSLESIRIGGAERSVLVVEFDAKLSGDLEGTQLAVNRIDPDASLTLADEVRSDVRQGAVRVQTAYTAQMRSLTPS